MHALQLTYVQFVTLFVHSTATQAIIAHLCQGDVVCLHFPKMLQGIVTSDRAEVDVAEVLKAAAGHHRVG